MQDTCWIQLLLLATLSTVDRPLRFHNTEPLGAQTCSSASMIMSACESQKLQRRTFVHKQDPTDHLTELQVEHFKCTPEPKSIFCCRSDSCQSSTRCSCQREKAIDQFPSYHFSKVRNSSQIQTAITLLPLHLSEVRTSEAVNLSIPRLIHQGSHPRTQS